MNNNNQFNEQHQEDAFDWSGISAPPLNSWSVNPLLDSIRSPFVANPQLAPGYRASLTPNGGSNVQANSSPINQAQGNQSRQNSPALSANFPPIPPQWRNRQSENNQANASINDSQINVHQANQLENQLQSPRPSSAHPVGTCYQPPPEGQAVQTDRNLLFDVLEEIKKVNARVDALCVNPSSLSLPPQQPHLVRKNPFDQRALTRANSAASLNMHHNQSHASSVRFAELPVFDGDWEHVHPKDFVAELSFYFSFHNTPESVRLHDVGRLLTGVASHWYRVLKHKFLSFDHFVGEFLACFWGTAQQTSIRTALYTGRCPPGTNELVTYFLRQVNNAQYLDEPLSEAATVSTILAHFPLDVRQAFTHADTFTICSAMAILQRVENNRKLPKYGIQQAYSMPPPMLKNESYKQENYKNKQQNSSARVNVAAIEGPTDEMTTMMPNPNQNSLNC